MPPKNQDLASISTERWAELYWGPDRPTPHELAARFGVSDATIRNYLKQHKIKLRGPSEAANIAYAKGRRKGWNLSEEARARQAEKLISLKLTPMKGRKLSKEARRKVSEARAGRVEVLCDQCGTSIMIKPYRTAQSETICCSRECAARLRSFRRKYGFEPVYRNVTHGDSQTPLYHRWQAIRARCSNPNHPDFARYGGRGITLCSGWQNWITFRDWVLSNGFQDGLEVHRLDNDAGYWCGCCPECQDAGRALNCRCVTHKDNARNTERSRRLTAWGETKTLIEWSEDPRCMVGYPTLIARFQKPWKAEDMIALPSVRGRKDIRMS